MTPAELRAYVYGLTLIEETTANTDLINTYLEQGYFDLCTAADWPWMITATTDLTFDGTTNKSVALPSNFFKIVSLWEADRNVQLKQLAPATAIAEYSGAGDTGEPIVYYLAGGEIVVKPIPDSEYTLSLDYYVFTAVDFTLTTEPPFAEQFHRALAEFATAKVWEREEDYERAQVNFSLFRDTVSRMFSHYNDRGTSTPLIYGQRKELSRATMPGVSGIQGNYWYWG